MCSTQDKTRPHRVTYASRRLENGIVVEERWYWLSGVEAMTETNGNKLPPWMSYRLVTSFGVFDQAGGKEPMKPGEKPTGARMDPDLAIRGSHQGLRQRVNPCPGLGLKPSASCSDMDNVVRHSHSLSDYISLKEMA